MLFKLSRNAPGLYPSQSNSQYRFWQTLPSCLVLGVGLFLLPLIDVGAQEASLRPVNAPVAKISPDDARYRIGPGDVLSVLVRKAPELSGQVRVDQKGMIRIPMIEGEVMAACRTEAELANDIKTLYLEYKQNPSVDVAVAEFQSRPVAVIGAVNAAGQFRLQRRVRLLELLSFAGGPTNNAGRTIQVIHTGDPYICEAQTSEPKDPVAVEGVGLYKLFDTLKGKEDANPFVRPGDIVRLPEADQVFIIGHVNSPGPIALKDKRITISRALAMAGGPARDGRTSRIRIIRQAADSDTKQEIFVDLNAIAKQRAEDVVLLPNDIVEVGASTGKTILNILSGAIPTAVTQGAVRAIP